MLSNYILTKSLAPNDNLIRNMTTLTGSSATKRQTQNKSKHWLSLCTALNKICTAGISCELVFSALLWNWTVTCYTENTVKHWKIFPFLEQRNEEKEIPQKWSEKMQFYDKGGDLKIGWNTATHYQYVY